MQMPKMKAAIAAIDRDADVEAVNPMGRDMAGESIHQYEYARTEQVAKAGRLLPSDEVVPGVNLSHFNGVEAEAMVDLQRIANGNIARRDGAPFTINEWVDALKKIPEPQKMETLSQFIRRQGGIGLMPLSLASWTEKRWRQLVDQLQWPGMLKKPFLVCR
jgi:hypothetical protein